MRSTNSQSQTPLERSLGLEIQAEAKRQGVTHKVLQERTGINDRSFRRWFVSGDRHIPTDEIQKVADELGVPLSALTARAEAGVPLLLEADRAKDLAEDLAGATPKEREDLRRAIERTHPTTRRKRIQHPDAGSSSG